MYSNIRSKPQLKADSDGTVNVVGGEQTYPNPSIMPLNLQPREATVVDTPLPTETEKSEASNPNSEASPKSE